MTLTTRKAVLATLLYFGATLQFIPYTSAQLQRQNQHNNQFSQLDDILKTQNQYQQQNQEQYQLENQQQFEELQEILKDEDYPLEYPLSPLENPFIIPENQEQKPIEISQNQQVVVKQSQRKTRPPQQYHQEVFPVQQFQIQRPPPQMRPENYHQSQLQSFGNKLQNQQQQDIIPGLTFQSQRHQQRRQENKNIFQQQNQLQFQENQQPFSQKSDIAQFFRQCHYTSPDFDICMMGVLNQLNFLFPTGVPEYDIPPFDPFFASEVETEQKGQLLSFRLKLTDVLESGWTTSTVTKFTSDLKNHRVTVEQTWPDKRLAGGYLFEGKILGQQIFRNKGKFNLTLLGFNQTTQLTRTPGEYDDEGTPLVRCRVSIQGVKDIRLHITNLLFGARNIEYVLDGIINATWRPFYPLTKPLVNNLVSKAFTKILTRAFRKVPFEYFFVA